MRSQWTGSPASVKMSCQAATIASGGYPRIASSSNHPSHDPSVWKRPVPRYGRNDEHTRRAASATRPPACAYPIASAGMSFASDHAAARPYSSGIRAGSSRRSSAISTSRNRWWYRYRSGRPGSGTTSGFERAISARSAADPLRADHHVTQLGDQLAEDRGPRHESESTLRQAPQELVPHVVHDHPVVATEPARRRIPVVVVTDRQAREVDRDRPSFRPTRDDRDRSVGQIEAEPSNQFGGLGVVHRQIAVVELEEPARRPKPRERQVGHRPGCEGDGPSDGGVVDQARDDVERVRARQQVDVVQHQEDRARRTGPSPSSVPARASPARESPSSSIAGAGRDRAGGSRSRARARSESSTAGSSSPASKESQATGRGSRSAMAASNVVFP